MINDSLQVFVEKLKRGRGEVLATPTGVTPSDNRAGKQARFPDATTATGRPEAGQESFGAATSAQEVGKFIRVEVLCPLDEAREGEVGGLRMLRTRSSVVFMERDQGVGGICTAPASQPV